MKKEIIEQMENHFINFMMNDANENTFTFRQLWEIEFHEGGQIWMDSIKNELMLRGDNGSMTLSELTTKNLTNKI